MATGSRLSGHVRLGPS